MVEGEENPGRLKKATNLYRDLRKRHPDMPMTPPAAFDMLLTRSSFRDLLDKAEQSLKSEQYDKARAILDDVSDSLAHNGRVIRMPRDLIGGFVSMTQWKQDRSATQRASSTPLWPA